MGRHRWGDGRTSRGQLQADGRRHGTHRCGHAATPELWCDPPPPPRLVVLLRHRSHTVRRPWHAWRAVQTIRTPLQVHLSRTTLHKDHTPTSGAAPLRKAVLLSMSCDCAHVRQCSHTTKAYSTSLFLSTPLGSVFSAGFPPATALPERAECVALAASMAIKRRQ